MRGEKRSSAHSRTTCGSSPSKLDRELPRLQLVDQLDRHQAASSFSCAAARRLQARELAELFVGQPLRERREALALGTTAQPAGHEPVDGGVELLGRDAAEEWRRDLRLRAEAAAHEDVVGLAALAVVVARRRPLEADVGDPVLRARVRAPVELEAELVRRIAEALLQVLDEPS